MILRTKLFIDKRHFYWAEVHESPSALLAAATKRVSWKKLRVRQAPIAMCVSYVHKRATLGKKKFKRTGLWRAPVIFTATGELGTVYFQRKRCDCSVLAHEFTHAALYWARQLKLRPMQKGEGSACSHEERFCQAIETMTRQFIHVAVKHGYNGATIPIK